jgi:uncharacterized protein YyaL (SSP411 family)
MAVFPDTDHFFRDLYGEERGVLRIRLPLAETLRHTRFRNPDALLAGLARERSILLQARQRRDQPARDEKILVGANGLAIEAFAASAAASESRERNRRTNLARRLCPRNKEARAPAPR